MDENYDDDETVSSGSRFLSAVALLCFGIAALWTNETRFDLPRAAAKTQALSGGYEASALDRLERFSVSAAIDPNIEISGDIFRSVDGYLAIAKTAEIYAWTDNTSRDGSVYWEQKWMRVLEDNSRNSELVKRHDSELLLPADLQLDGLSIDAEHLEFIDRFEVLAPADLPLRSRYAERRTDARYLYPGGGTGTAKIGDERISWKGLRVPAGPVTYFGSYSGYGGSADLSTMNYGWFHELLGNEGGLHHIVIGDRATALNSLERYQADLKYVWRLVGTLCVVLGLYSIASSLFFLFAGIPILGFITELGAIVFALVVGIPLSAVVMLAGFVVANVWLLCLVLIAGAFGIYKVKGRNAASSAAIVERLKKDYKQELRDYSLAEIEFMELATLADIDGDLHASERKWLFSMGERQGWSLDHCSKLIEAAQQKTARKAVPKTRLQLENLIRLALADGTLSVDEIKLIRSVAAGLRVEDAELKKMIIDLRSDAAADSALPSLDTAVSPGG